MVVLCICLFPTLVFVRLVFEELLTCFSVEKLREFHGKCAACHSLQVRRHFPMKTMISLFSSEFRVRAHSNTMVKYIHSNIWEGVVTKCYGHLSQVPF